MQTAEKKYKATSPSTVYKYNGIGGGSPVGADIYGSFPITHNYPVKMAIIDNNSPTTGNQPLPDQGDRDDQRNGDEIYAKGIRLRIQLENDAGRHNNTYKMWMIEMNSTSGDCCVPTQLFHDVTGNNILNPIQTDRWSCTYLGQYRTKARDVEANKKSDIFVNKWFPFKRKLKFVKDDTTSVARGMKEQLWLVIVGYDSSNSTGDLGLGNFRVSATLYYSDP